MNILEQPLVAYSGIMYESGKHLTFYGHKGFVPGWSPSSESCSSYITGFEDEKLYLIWGNLKNPYFSWLIYAVKGCLGRTVSCGTANP